MNVTDESGNTALMKAVKLSSKAISQLLVKWGAEVNAENHKGETALYLAVTQSHAEYEKISKQSKNRNKQKHILNEDFLFEGSSLMVHIILRGGAHLHETKSGLNPCTVHLNSAEFKKPNPTVLKMLDAGGFKENMKELFSVNLLQDYVRDFFRQHLIQAHPERNLYFIVPQLGLPKRLQSYLLFHAVQHSNLVPSSEEKKLLQKIQEGETENVKHLINAGVDVNVRDENDMTGLMIASQAGQKQLVEQLLESEADINLQDSSGDTALIHALKYQQDKNFVKYLKKIQECAQVLLQHDADINIQGKDGDTALMHLARTTSFIWTVIPMYKEKIENLTKDTAVVDKFMFAFINAGADPNATNDKGNTALILGANNLHFVKKMIKVGADVNWEDKDGNTALNQAASFGAVDCTETLIEAGAEINNGQYTALSRAAQNGHLQCVKLLIREGADLDVQNKIGKTALMAAAAAGRVECLKLLIREGANLDIWDEEGHPALMFAAGNRHLECVKLLIQEGADLDIWDEKGHTALVFAAKVGHVECVKVLIQSGADLDIQGGNGATALMYSAVRGHMECVKLLVEGRADLNIREEHGYTALMIAALNGFDSCFSTLIEAGAEVDSSDIEVICYQTKPQATSKDSRGKILNLINSFQSFGPFVGLK